MVRSRAPVHPTPTTLSREFVMTRSACFHLLSNLQSRLDPTRWRVRSAFNWTGVAAVVALFGLTIPTPALAQIPATYEGFDYSTGSLNGESDGTGDWKDPWSGDSQLRVETPGFTHTDSASNELTVSGNRVGKSGSANSTNKISRTINGKVNSGTVWVSAILDGRNGSRINNFALGDGLFMVSTVGIHVRYIAVQFSATLAQPG